MISAFSRRNFIKSQLTVMYPLLNHRYKNLEVLRQGIISFLMEDHVRRKNGIYY